MNETIQKGGRILLSFFSFLREETGDPRARMIELVLLFILGIIAGAILKTIIGPFTTIGYEDYQLNGRPHFEDLNIMQKEALLKGTLTSLEEGPTNKACSQ